MSKRVGNITRLILILSGLGLIAVLFVPLWTIDLQAPQYPEGLALIIYPNGLGGNVEIINGLNHYIGMKTLHTEDFFEFKVLPYLIGFFAVAFLVVGAIGRRKWMYILLSLYIVFGVIAMVDFYKWEYNYGHDLNPHAAIQVPGMAYQPPLIGYKQLLNFSAYSIPAMGGWIFLGVGALAILCFVLEIKRVRKWKHTHSTVKSVVAVLLFSTLSSCSYNPEPLKIGVDNCHFCKMTISDARFGAEIVTMKGKVYKFDDSHCIIAFLKSNAVKEKEIKAIYLTDFDGDHKLIEANSALLLQSEELKSPMGGNVAAFSSKESLDKIKSQYKALQVSWKDIKK
jgi:copper chaperone NosL